MQLFSIFLMMDPQGKDSSSFSLLFMGLMILVFWMVMIRPQAKKATQQKTFISDFKKDDKVVTIAGIHSSINKVNEGGTINLKVSPGSYLKIKKKHHQYGNERKP